MAYALLAHFLQRMTCAFKHTQSAQIIPKMHYVVILYRLLHGWELTKMSVTEVFEFAHIEFMLAAH